jgi:NADH:ubiquinone oxidoreductase subunit 6 (subunit J)
LRWNKVVVVVVISCQNKKIIALVDIVLVAIGIGGMIPLNLRQSALPGMASGALIQECHNFFTLYSVPFTMITRLLLTAVLGLLSKQREEDKHV